jgi:6-phosphogluconolactonase
MAIPRMISANEIDVWLGTSSAKLSKGIYHCTLNTDNGKLSESRLVAEIRGPGFLAMHPSRKALYAVGTLEGVPSVVAYAIGRNADDEPQLTLINSAEIGDGGAAHVSIDPTGRSLLTAQYGGGSVAVFALQENGSIKERTQLIKHEGGARVVAGRQDASHAHWTGFAPDNRFAFVPDLGLDKVLIYRFDPNTSKLQPHGFGEVPPGGGPRHMKFHPNGKWIYVLNELDLSVSVFDYDPQAGTMTIKQTIPTVPKKQLAKEKFTSASEIRMHPNGHFAYAANRGHDTITVFEIDPQSGQLSVVERENVRGATPRNFNLDPSANWLLAAGQDSHTLASFSVDSDSGELMYNQSIIHTPAPICVLFEPVP